MSPDDQTPAAGSDPFEIDFSAIVAEHNAASGGPSEQRGSSRRRSRRDRSDSAPTEGPTTGPAPTAAAAATIDGPSESGDGSTSIASGSSRSSRWWRIGYPSAIVASLVVVIALVWAGFAVILDSTDGQLSHRVEDPAALGYEAALEKTPTALVLVVGADGSLATTSVVSLISDSSAGMLVIPSQVMLKTNYGENTAAQWYKSGGKGAVAAGVGTMLQLGFNDVIEIPVAQWTTLMAPYGSLTVVNPDPVRDSTDKQVFAKGSVTLSADQIPAYLGDLGPKDSDLLRVTRAEGFWKALLEKIKSSQASFPLQTTSGLGYFLSSAARGTIAISDLPVAPTTTPAGQPQQYAVQKAAAQDALAAIVPFPDGGGMRARFRVLDGTGVLNNGIGAALVLAAAGGQIDVVGNANRFDIDTTTFYYYEGTTEEVAAIFRDALGLGDLKKNDASNAAADIVVILGSDYADRGGATAATSSTTVAR